MLSAFRTCNQVAPLTLAIVAFTLAGCVSGSPRSLQGIVDVGIVGGTATYRERIALPPDATFEAVLEDVSLVDVPAIEIARTSITGASGPPFRFSISYDRARIDPQHSYSIRARILVDGRLLFTTDTSYPVLTRGAGSTVDMAMRMVGEGERGAASASGPQ